MIQYGAMDRPENSRDPSRQPALPAADWLSTLRAYLNEDWLSLGIAEYLSAHTDAARATQRLSCLGCGQRFPRVDLWIHHKFDEVAYCDACYYRRFGRKAD
jgi:hypothetical protein